MKLSLEAIENQSDEWISSLLNQNGIRALNNSQSSSVDRLTAVEFLDITGNIEYEDSIYVKMPIFSKLFNMSKLQLVQYIQEISNDIALDENNTPRYTNPDIPEISRIDLIKNIIKNISSAGDSQIELKTIYMSDPIVKTYRDSFMDVIYDQFEYVNISFGYNLPKKILIIMKNLLNSFGYPDISIDEINKKWLDLTKPRNSESLKLILSIRSLIHGAHNILSSELDLVKQKDGIECDIWAVMLTVAGSYYGSILVFHNTETALGPTGEEGVMIQEINKSIPALILQEIYPEISNKLPKINTLLEPGIIGIANFVQVPYIYVNPIDRQRYILEKYYSYEFYSEAFDPNLKIPCNDLVAWYEWYRKKIN